MIISITTPDSNTTDIYLDKVALCIRNPVARVITFKMLNHDNSTHTFDNPEAYNTVIDQLQTYYRAKLLECMPPTIYMYEGPKDEKEIEKIMKVFKPDLKTAGSFSSREMADNPWSKFKPFSTDNPLDHPTDNELKQLHSKPLGRGPFKNIQGPATDKPTYKRDLSQGTGGL